MRDNQHRPGLRPFLYLLCLSLSLFFMSGCASSPKTYTPKPEGSHLKIWVASDLHYLDPSLTKPGPLFDQTYKNADGKQTQDIQVITDALIDKALKEKPDALILSGDLSFNGEKASHEGLAKKLEVLRKAGVPVLVIPGNHDINNFYAYRYDKDRIQPTDQVSPGSFEKIYAHDGYEGALSRDPSSLSYIFELSKDLRIIMLDSCIYENNSRLNPSASGGRIRPSTLEWLEEQLKEAEKEGVNCLSVSHHNLLVHNQDFFSSFTIENSHALVELYTQYKVPMNLSGHMHIQHMEYAELKGFQLVDIATGALSVRGNALGIIDYQAHKTLSYERQSLDVSSYAKASGLTQESLLNFPEYSRQFFYDLSYQRSYKSLLEKQVPPADASAMASVLTELNMAYFEGSLSSTVPKLKNLRGYKLLEEQKGDFTHAYFRTMIQETGEHQKTKVNFD